VRSTILTCSEAGRPAIAPNANLKPAVIQFDIQGEIHLYITVVSPASIFLDLAT
jgi:hypothetical protein